MEKIPNDLLSVISRAKDELENNKLHHLDPCWRFEIYSCLDINFIALVADMSSLINADLRASFYLSEISVLYVIPIWEMSVLETNMPQRLISLASECIDISEVPRKCLRYLDESDRNLTRMLRTEDEHMQRVLHVGTTALIAAELGVAHRNRFMRSFALKPHNQYWGEMDIDIYSSDASRWAAVAYAGGIWSPSFDRQKSRDFWLWWLEEAVPKTWRRLLSELPDNQ